MNKENTTTYPVDKFKIKDVKVVVKDIETGETEEKVIPLEQLQDSLKKNNQPPEWD